MDEKDNFVVLIPESDQLLEMCPLFCPVCQLSMVGIEDILSHKKHKCCHFCVQNFVESRSIEWAAGWRPSLEEIKKKYQ